MRFAPGIRIVTGTRRHGSYRRLLPILWSGCLFVFPASETQARTTATWTGGTGNWHSAGKRNPGNVHYSAALNVVVDTNMASDSMVTFDNNATIGRLSVDTGDSLTVGNNRWLSQQTCSFCGSGQIVLNGLMTMQPGVIQRLLSFSPHTFPVTGGGSIDHGSNGVILASLVGNSLVNGVSIFGDDNIQLSTVHNGENLATGPNGINPGMSRFTINGAIDASSGSKVTASRAGTAFNAGQIVITDGSAALLFFNGSSNVRDGIPRGTNGREVLLSNDNPIPDGETNGGLSIIDGSETFGYDRTLTVNAPLNNERTSYIHSGRAMPSTASPLVQYSAATKNEADSRTIGGSFRFAGRDIDILAGTLRHYGDSWQVINTNGSHALTGLSSMDSTGSLHVDTGAVLATTASFTNFGTIQLGVVGDCGVWFTQGNCTRWKGETSLDGGSLISGGTIASLGGDLHGNGLVQSRRGTPAVLLDKVVAPLTNRYFVIFGGTIEISWRLGLFNNRTYFWSLDSTIDNPTGSAGVDWDLVKTNHDAFGGKVQLLMSGWNVWCADSCRLFRTSDHQWDNSRTNAGGITASMSLSNPDFAMRSFGPGKVPRDSSSTLRLYFNSCALPKSPAAGLPGMGLTEFAAYDHRIRTAAVAG